jgi:hypothetical protein
MPWRSPASLMVSSTILTARSRSSGGCRGPNACFDLCCFDAARGYILPKNAEGCPVLIGERVSTLAAPKGAASVRLDQPPTRRSPARPPEAAQTRLGETMPKGEDTGLGPTDECRLREG